MDVHETSNLNAGKTEKLDSESKNTPPEATKNSGIESSASEPGPRGKAKPRKGIEGARRLVCKRCQHFLAEVKATAFEALVLCHRCKTENSFAYQELG